MFVFYFPDLNKIMAESRDYDELLFAWQGWRNASGREIRDSYKRYVELANFAAKSNGQCLTIKQFLAVDFHFITFQHFHFIS